MGTSTEKMLLFARAKKVSGIIVSTPNFTTENVILRDCLATGIVRRY